MEILYIYNSVLLDTRVNFNKLHLIEASVLYSIIKFF